MFFAWRIKVLSTSFTLFILIVVLAIPQFGMPSIRTDRDSRTQCLQTAAGGIAYTALTIKAGAFEEFRKYIGVIIGWIASSVVCDLVITVTLTITLVCSRSVQASRGTRVNQYTPARFLFYYSGDIARIGNWVKLLNLFIGLKSVSFET